MRAVVALLALAACSSSKAKPAPDATPRAPPAKIASATFALEASSLTYAYDVEVERAGRPSISAACQLGGPAATDADEPDVTLRAGEVVHVTGALFEGGALTLRPRQCELTLYLRRAGGGSTELARHCLRDGVVTAGACA